MTDYRIEGLGPVLDVVVVAFSTLGIDFYMVGALAKDSWFMEGNLKSRRTKDVDFAVLVTGSAQFNEVKDFLIQQHLFEEVKDNPFRLKTPDDYHIDIIPFGGLSIEGVTSVDSIGVTVMNVDGFSIVHKIGTVIKTFSTGHSIRVASLPAIVLLKLIAYFDVPESRAKDPGDVAMILYNYFELQPEFIISSHLETFNRMDELGHDLRLISSYVVGSEIRKMTITDPELQVHVERILDQHLEQGYKNHFFRYMLSALSIEGVRVTLETVMDWISALQKGIKDLEME